MPKYVCAAPEEAMILVNFEDDYDDPTVGAGQVMKLSASTQFDSSRVVWDDGEWIKFINRKGYVYIRRKHLLLQPDSLERAPDPPYRRPFGELIATSRRATGSYFFYDEGTDSYWAISRTPRGWAYISQDTPEAQFGFTSKKAAMGALDQYLSVRHWDSERGWHIQEPEEEAGIDR